MHRQVNRAYSLIREIIATLDLDLSGLTVLTEVGSGAFIYSPVIAAAAGSKRVFAWTADSPYGNGAEVVSICKKLMVEMGMDPGAVEFAVNERPERHVTAADLITNLGFVRPLNREFLEKVKQGAVISYMSEAWELRAGDIDLEFCRTRGIRVAGTWENHPDLKIFDACGPLALKLCLEAGYEVYQNKIMIVSNDHFGKVAYDTLNTLQPAKLVLSSIEDASEKLKEDFDFILIADYTHTGELAGNNGLLDLQKSGSAGIVHLAGKVNATYVKDLGMKIFPDKNGSDHRMTQTLAYLGVKPVIDLHAAGMKVGQLLINDQKSELVQFIC